MSRGFACLNYFPESFELNSFRFFERHLEINPQDTYYMAEKELRDARSIQIDVVLDEQAKREIDAIGPTGAMFGWALGSVKWLLEK